MGNHRKISTAGTASILVFTSNLLCGIVAQAATCSCAGVSLADNINIADFEAEKFQFSASYSYHDISRLVAQSDTIQDETGRVRRTESLSLRLSYGINAEWAISGLISYVDHFRNIAISGSDGESATGLGDSMLLLSYAPLKISPFEQNEFAAGIGLRFATGENNKGSPVVFAEDLQPGQGSNGSSLWLHYGRSFSQKADWQLFVNANYQKNGTNARDYSFESEWNFSCGVSYASSSAWSTSLALTYRKADPHTRFSSPLPNTGGSWLDFSPSFGYKLSDQSSVGVAFRIPVKRDLNGELQFTTQSFVSLSYAYRW